jgi:D-alanine-D-alanine ligase
MSQIRVGVVRGGPSTEYPVSLDTGEHVLRRLPRDKYTPVDILLTKKGEWYMNGVQTDLGAIAHHVDVIWNALHGAFGEDGKVQQLFEQFGIPYTGSGVMASAVGMHKDLAKSRFKEAGLLTPRGDVISPDDVLDEVAAQMSKLGYLPAVVKPVSGGSSIGASIARTCEELEQALVLAAKHGDILVEEMIEGKEATCCVIDAGKGGEHIVLCPIEIVPAASKDLFDYDAKYGGESEEIVPGRFTIRDLSRIRELASKAHRAIGARHYSRSDFIVSPGGIYILEINTLPGLTEESLTPKALAAAELEFPDFLDHILSLALAR